MGKRSYAQYCGLAAALDVIGERWALLIVRDLVPGPRRFTDLFDGLPVLHRSAHRSASLTRDGRCSAPTRGFALRCRHSCTNSPTGAPNSPDWQDGSPSGERLCFPTSPTPATVSSTPAGSCSHASRYRGGFPDGDVHFLIDGTDELTLSLEGDVGRLRYGHSDSLPLLTVAGQTDAVVAVALPTRRRRSPVNEIAREPGLTCLGARAVLQA